MSSENCGVSSTCDRSQPVLFMALGRICSLDTLSCFHWHNAEAIKACPVLKRNGVEPGFRQEVLEPLDNFTVRIKQFAQVNLAPKGDSS